MILAASPHRVLPESLPTAVVCLMAGGALAAWACTHLLKRYTGGLPFRSGEVEASPGSRRAGRIAFVVRSLVGLAALLLVGEAIQRFMLFATNWPVWPMALVGAVGVEFLVAAYALERQTVPRGQGLILAALRLAVLLLVVLMLAKPVWSRQTSEEFRRSVAILLDRSPSMHVPDTQLTPSEKLRLGETLSMPEAKRPYRLDEVSRRIAQVGRTLTAEGEWMAMLKDAEAELRQEHLSKRRKALDELLEGAGEALSDELAALGKPLEGRIRLTKALEMALTNLKGDVVKAQQRLTDARRITAKRRAELLGQQYDKLTDYLRRAAVELGELAEKVDSAGAAVDEAYYIALPQEKRRRLDVLGQKTRWQMAREVLLHRPVGDAEDEQAGRSLLDELRSEYDVKLYCFDSTADEVDLAEWLADAGDSASRPATNPSTNPTTNPTTQPSAIPTTDLAAPLERLAGEFAPGRLGGVLLFTDGRHTAASAVDGVAGQLSRQKVPISSVLMGSKSPPRDAAIVAVDAPETVYLKDKLYVQVKLKLDGLKDRTVGVHLYDGEKSVDKKEIEVPLDSFRTSVQLSDEPKEQGPKHYRIEIDHADGEVFADNNEQPVSVSVTDDRAKLLLIDGRSRWEFRYLKNLFADRDRTVQLQYVLLTPDKVAGQTDRRKVYASAARKPGEVEATALPDKPEEWMKFDVIILGDAPPDRLGPGNIEAIQTFVSERGGTLIVIAGPRFMPLHYPDSPLEDLLPVVLRERQQGATRPAVTEASQAPPKPIEPIVDQFAEREKLRGYKLCLTAEGRSHVVMRQKVDSEENLRLWESLPRLFWRARVLRTKPGATVLAYAMPPRPGDDERSPIPLRDRSLDETPKKAEPRTRPDNTEEALRAQREFEGKHPLIVHQNVALGRVMFLACDRTWRLRYRVGDPHHHKFWGQVLRWATANKLPAGTDHVKIGTDRSRYDPDHRIRVRAKLVDETFSPIIDDAVAVKLFRDGKLLLRRKLKYTPNSPGIYAGDLGQLSAGLYRVELDAPAAKEILEKDKAEKVAAEFSVAADTPVEQVELGADRSLLTRLATLTGGAVADPNESGLLPRTFRPGRVINLSRKQFVLWDSWLLLALIVLAATAEWILRKKVGLP